MPTRNPNGYNDAKLKVREKLLEQKSRIEKRVRQMQVDLVADSPVKSEIAKDMLARTLAILFAHYETLHIKSIEGIIDTDDSKAIPAIAQNIKRLCETLKLTEERQSDIIIADEVQL
jgi:hypothetical protein